MAVNLSFERAVGYINGNSLAGQISEIELPELEWETIDRENLGDIGLIQYPTTLSELECTVTWTDFNQTLALACANPYTIQQLQIRINLGEYTPAGKVADRLLKVDMRGSFLTNQIGSLASNDPMDIETMMKVYYLKQTFNNNDILELDLQTPTYRVNGVDLLADMRQNLGLN